MEDLTTLIHFNNEFYLYISKGLGTRHLIYTVHLFKNEGSVLLLYQKVTLKI